MPESTCLHIQDRESGPIRVVELPWISVRIGRAAYCEVRLSGEDLAEETCRLTRRGRTWSLVPTGSWNLVVLEGRTVQGPCPLPFDVPFQIGPYCLTLRHDVAAEPDWEIYPATFQPLVAPPISLSPLAITFGTKGDHDRAVAGPILDSETGGNAPRRVATGADGRLAGKRPKPISSPALRDSRSPAKDPAFRRRRHSTPFRRRNGRTRATGRQQRPRQ